MKQLTCEMCGGTELIKQDGVFVCQNCGTKYSVEEAKKMMIEGTVEVAGTVKIDDSSKIDNYYTMAENAYNANNKQEAENYCNKIIEINPHHFEAWLLKGKSAGWQSTLRNIRIEETVNCFSKAIDNAPEENLEDIKAEVAEEIDSLSLALLNLCCDNYSSYPSEDNASDILSNLKLVEIYTIMLLAKCGVKSETFKSKIATKINDSVCAAWANEIWKDYSDDQYPSKYTWQEFKERGFTAVKLLQTAIDLCDDDDNSDIQRYKNMIHIKQALVDSCSWTYSNGNYVPEYSLTEEAKTINIDDIMKYHQKIKDIDPNYVIPERPTAKTNGGCYVATCVYGSYDCPQVWTLRRYRDYTLAKSWYGRTFIKTYYTISPTLVKWFGHTEWFKKMWQSKLDNIVEKLQAKGIESTPYEDINW